MVEKWGRQAAGVTGRDGIESIKLGLLTAVARSHH
jgi:hypothetical protein